MICYGDHPDLHSFPTRRSSDLLRARLRAAKLWDRERPAVMLRFLGVGGAVATPSAFVQAVAAAKTDEDRKSTRLNSSHVETSYAVFCLKKKTQPFVVDVGRHAD